MIVRFPWLLANQIIHAEALTSLILRSIGCALANKKGKHAHKYKLNKVNEIASLHSKQCHNSKWSVCVCVHARVM